MKLQNRLNNGFRELTSNELEVVCGGNDTIEDIIIVLPSGTSDGTIDPDAPSTDDVILVSVPNASAYLAPSTGPSLAFVANINTGGPIDQVIFVGGGVVGSGANGAGNGPAAGGWIDLDGDGEDDRDGDNYIDTDGDGQPDTIVVVGHDTTPYQLANPYTPTYLTPIDPSTVLVAAAPNAVLENFYAEIGFSYYGLAAGAATNGNEPGAFLGLANPGFLFNAGPSTNDDGFGFNYDITVTGGKPGVSATASASLDDIVDGFNSIFGTYEQVLGTDAQGNTIYGPVQSGSPLGGSNGDDDDPVNTHGGPLQ